MLSLMATRLMTEEVTEAASRVQREHAFHAKAGLRGILHRGSTDHTHRSRIKDQRVVGGAKVQTK